MRIQLSLLLLAATQIGATDCGEVLRDPGFDVWCGENLCVWKVVRGDVKRVDTWHEGDSGVELIGTDAAIAQLSPVNFGDGNCIEFELLANVSKEASAHLELDIYGDGSIDHRERIGTSNWEPITFKLHIARPYTGIRFELTKQGPGTAAFANIGARVSRTGCEGLPVIPHGTGPLGALCLVDADCESAMCRRVEDLDPDLIFGESLRCVSCDDTTCGTDVCGVSEPTSPVLAVPLRCEPPGGSELGEQCVIASECATGVCTNGFCSTCNLDSAVCANGEECRTAWFPGPYVCSPGAGIRKAGEACATSADCASGACTGPVRKACESDGRPCGNDTNCPVDNGLIPGTCVQVGVTGGSCE
jgi:hypothetical protein